MFAFQWNALRSGDRVLVHDDRAPDLDTHTGVVASVETRTRQHTTHNVAIRIDNTGKLVRPSRHAVHQLPIDHQLSCWRCNATPLHGRPADLDADAV